MTDDLHAPGTLLGLYWMLFGVGAVLGSLAVGALRQLPLWPVTVTIVIAWGLTLLPFGLDAPTPLTVACFTLGGVIYGPFVALSMTLLQAKSPPQHLSVMLAANNAVLLTASPSAQPSAAPSPPPWAPPPPSAPQASPQSPWAPPPASCWRLGGGGGEGVDDRARAGSGPGPEAPGRRCAPDPVTWCEHRRRGPGGGVRRVECGSRGPWA